MNKRRGRCKFCLELVAINQLVKSMEGLPILVFHLMDGRPCQGYNKPPMNGQEAREYREFVRAFTENKHGELA